MALTLARLVPLNPALEAAGIHPEDYKRDPKRPPATIIGDTLYVEQQAWMNFQRAVMARACFDGAGYAQHEQPRWCRPGVLAAALLEDAPLDSDGQPVKAEPAV